MQLFANVPDTEVTETMTVPTPLKREAWAAEPVRFTLIPTWRDLVLFPDRLNRLNRLTATKSADFERLPASVRRHYAQQIVEMKATHATKAEQITRKGSEIDAELRRIDVELAQLSDLP